MYHLKTKSSTQSEFGANNKKVPRGVIWKKNFSRLKTLTRKKFHLEKSSTKKVPPKKFRTRTAIPANNRSKASTSTNAAPQPIDPSSPSQPKLKPLPLRGIKLKYEKMPIRKAKI